MRGVTSHSAACRPREAKQQCEKCLRYYPEDTVFLDLRHREKPMDATLMFWPGGRCPVRITDATRLHQVVLGDVKSA